MRKNIVLAGLILLGAWLVSASTFFQPASFDEPTPVPLQPAGLSIEAGTLPCDPSAVHGLYFYSQDCPHCEEVLNNLLLPMQDEFGTKLDIRLVEIDYADNYELLIHTEEHFGVKAEERAIPTLVIGDRVMIGQDVIESELRGVVENGILSGGIDWPDIPNFDPAAIVSKENADAKCGNLFTG